MVDYQANSDKSKKELEAPDKKKLEKVVSGTVVKKPQTISSKFKGVFLGGDWVTARDYVVSDVLLPAIRNLVTDMISKGVDRLVYGDTPGRRRSPSTYAPRVQYNNPIYRDPRTRSSLPDQNPATRWAQGRKSFEDIIVVSKEDADNVVDQLTAVVDQYEVVSIADLYDLLGLPSTHVDNKWGWTHLANITVRQVNDGWRISFPPLEEVS